MKQRFKLAQAHLQGRLNLSRVAARCVDGRVEMDGHATGSRSLSRLLEIGTMTGYPRGHIGTQLADTLLGLEAAYDAADKTHGPAKLDALATLRALHAQAARHMLSEGGPLGDVLAALSPGLPALLPPGTPLAELPLLGAAPAILRLARETGAAPEAAAEAWAAVAGQFHLAALRAAAEAAPVSGQFGNRARAALLADLDTAQARLAGQGLRGGALPAAAEAVAKLVEQAGRVPDLSAVTVAARALAGLH